MAFVFEPRTYGGNVIRRAFTPYAHEDLERGKFQSSFVAADLAEMAREGLEFFQPLRIGPDDHFGIRVR